MAIVLVAEPFAAAGIAALRRAEHDVVEGPADHARLADADALIVRSATQVTAELLRGAPHLRVIGRAGIGVDNIDLDAATDAGVLVINAPDANAVSAAEHTLALTLAQARHVPQAHASLNAGEWHRSRFAGVELKDKTLGILGLGRIGGLVATRAAAFGMRVVGFDQYVNPEYAEQLGVELLDTLPELLAASDFVTVHLPMNAETTGLIGAAELRTMKRTARIINVARGGIIDESALADAVRMGEIAGAAIDVFCHEPPAPDSPLLNVDGIVVTPHLGASTAEAQDRAAISVVAGVCDALAGALPSSAVNLPVGNVHPEVASLLGIAELCGRLVAQRAVGRVEEVFIDVEGRAAVHDVRAIGLAAVAGTLTAATDEPISFVNATRLADERGITFTTATTVSDRVANTSVDVHVGKSRAKGEHSAASGNRLVAVDDFVVDIRPSGRIVAIDHDDAPGIVGIIGTAFGAADINIDEMHISRSDDAETALTVLACASEVPTSVTNGLLHSPHVHRVAVTLVQTPRR